MEALRRNRPQVYVPRSFQALSLLNEVSPRRADRVMRLVRGG